MGALFQTGAGIASLFGKGPGGSVPSVPSINDLLNLGPSALQSSEVDFFGGEQDVRTEDMYARLGLGNSTMEAQDLGGNELARLAELAKLQSQNQQVALQSTGQNLTAQQQAFNQGNTALTNITKGLSGIFPSG